MANGSISGESWDKEEMLAWFDAWTAQQRQEILDGNVGAVSVNRDPGMTTIFETVEGDKCRIRVRPTNITLTFH